MKDKHFRMRPLFLGTSEPCEDRVHPYPKCLSRFFPAFTFAHRALCAAAIFRRAAADKF